MRHIVIWSLSAVTGAAFLLAGGLKLVGAPIEVQLFAAIGLGQALRYFTGLLEVAGAIALFVPAAAPFAAATLALVMLGAIATHLFIVGGSPLVPIALFAAALSIAYLRREQIGSRAQIA